MMLRETLKQVEALDVLKFPEAGDTDGGQLVQQCLELAKHLDEQATGVEGMQVDKLQVAFELAVAEGLKMDEVEEYRDTICGLHRILVEGKGDLFECYMRDLLREKRIAQTYRSLCEAFPPGSVDSGQLIAMMYSLGSHTALEVGRFPQAYDALRAINEQIDSILAGEKSLIEVLDFASKYLDRESHNAPAAN